MIKFVAAGLWLCAATIGAVFLSFQMSGAPEAATEEAPPLLGGLDYLATPIVSVPVLTDDGIVGYFLAKLVYTVEPEKLAKLSAPADALIADELYTYLFSNPDIDFTEVKTLDIEAFRKGVREAVNKRVGDELVHDVIIDQIDFLSKEEIRNNSMKRRAKTKIPTLGVDPGEAHGAAEDNPAH
jgi:hypothetical protein